MSEAPAFLEVDEAGFDTPCSRYKWAQPWVVEGAIAWMSAYLDEQGAGVRIFEWGSGGSTIWFAHRAACVITVEHQPAWAAALRVVAPPHVEVLEREATPPNFLEYASAIDDKGMFDLILVDGADGYDGGLTGSRPQCVARAIHHLRPAGAIVIDNAGSASNLQAVAICMAAWGGIHARHTFVGRVLEPKGHAREGRDVTETTIFVPNDPTLGPIYFYNP